MIGHRPFDTLGGASHGWLDARHHFSFANYYDPERLHWGALLRMRIVLATEGARTRAMWPPEYQY